jgi:hypothetical protein
VAKKTVNLSVSEEILHRFNQICGRYGHGKQKGMVLSAAILMFLEADSALQAEFVKRIAVASVDSHRQTNEKGVAGTGLGAAESKSDAKSGPLGTGYVPQKKAAKKARSAVKTITHLPHR